MQIARPAGVWRRMLLLILLVAAAPCVTLPAAADVPGPTIRVGLRRGLARVDLSCRGGFVLRDAAGRILLPRAESARIQVGRAGAQGASGEAGAAADGVPAPPAATEPPRVKPGTPCLEVTAAGADGQALPALALPIAAVVASPEAQDGILDAGWGRWRGALSLAPDHRGRLNVVNLVGLDDYVRGVVPVEMEPDAPPAALQAQAIAARSFALASLGYHASEGFDVCATTHCQCYRGVAAERASTDAAVQATRGQILRAGGKPLLALFHANCGGATESPAAAWGDDSLPACLHGGPDVPDACPLDVASEAGLLALAASADQVFCSSSPQFCWQFERTRAELERILARTLPAALHKRAPLGSLLSLSVAARTPSGRAAAVEVRGSLGTYTVRGVEVRRLFGSVAPDGQGLMSTRFVVRPVVQDGDAPPERYRFTGFGWGHGIGMCQDGAIGMARKGYAVEAILQHYYPGAVLGPAVEPAP